MNAQACVHNINYERGTYSNVPFTVYVELPHITPHNRSHTKARAFLLEGAWHADSWNQKEGIEKTEKVNLELTFISYQLLKVYFNRRRNISKAIVK